MNFFYQGLNKGEEEDVVRDNISEEDPLPWVDVQDMLFPRNRQGFLDDKLLKKLRMLQKIIIESDFLFFYQIILTMCDTSLSGIR